MTDQPLVAGIELGGTKCIAILATGPDDIRDEVRVPTTTPAETLTELEAVLDRWSDFAAIGIASFGPIGIDPGASGYGHVLATPKPGWTDIDVAGRFAGRFGRPVGFHTDVVGAALGEGAWGAARDLTKFAYVTVGTGVGVGLIAGGVPAGGATHPELGHVRPARLHGDDWIGICPFHGACVEGLASGPAIRARTGSAAEDLPADHPVWDGVAHTIAQLCHTLMLTGVPRRIVIGGGVMVGTQRLFPEVRRRLLDSLGGYVAPDVIGDPERLVVPPMLGGQAGPLGAIMLGRQAMSGA